MTSINDSELRRKVLEELDWEPSVDAAAIGVTAKDGVVTLTGQVASYAQKRDAERAAMHVAGVKAVAEELTVKLPGNAERSDGDIAQIVLSVLHYNVSLPSYERIKVTVEKGWVTLEGELVWQFQKEIAGNAVKHAIGVKGVSNRITIKPQLQPADVKTKIESAFTRHALLDANQIKVEAVDSKVVLRGNVRSWRERQEAEQAAWSAPGVSQVENNVVITPY